MSTIPAENAMKSTVYKLTFIFITLAYSNAKILQSKIKDFDFDAKDSVKLSYSESKDPLWVLDLNDDELIFNKLRSPNKMDRRVFREVMEPAIRHYKYKQLATVADEGTKANPTTPETEEPTEEITKYDVKKEILFMFNKFVMPYNGEPSLNVHLGDNNKVSVKLYFKGPFTSLVVRYKNKRWNYFLDPPSSLPRWFYEKHTNVTRSGTAMYVDIPDTVRNEFYGKFFYMLQAFLRFDI